MLAVLMIVILFLMLVIVIVNDEHEIFMITFSITTLL